MRISDWGSDVCSSDLSAIAVTCVAALKRGSSSNAMIKLPSSGAGKSDASMISRRVGLASSKPAVVKCRRVSASMSTATESPARKSVVKGKRVSGRVDLGGIRLIKKKKKHKKIN